MKGVQKVFATRHGKDARDLAVHVPNLMLVVAPAQGQGMGYTKPWRGLSKSEEAADGDAGGGELDWNAGFACINSHNAGQYTTCFCGEAKWLRVFSH